jgi:virginiamycin B lyase
MQRPNPTAPSATSLTIEPLEARRLLSAANVMHEFQLAIGSNPEKVVTGHDGSIYVYDQGTGKLERKRPGRSTFDSVDIPVSTNQHFGMVMSRKGEVFFTVDNGIATYSPRHNAVTIYNLGTDPNDVAQGADNAIWFTEPNANKIGCIALDKRGVYDPNGALSTLNVPTPNAGATSITTGPNGDLWFGEDFVGKVAQISSITSSSPQITEYSLFAGVHAEPVGITTGPDGNIWFAEVVANKIGTINQTTKAITEFDVPTANSQPF